MQIFYFGIYLKIYIIKIATRKQPGIAYMTIRLSVISKLTSYSLSLLRNRFEQLFIFYLFLILGVLVFAMILAWNNYEFSLQERYQARIDMNYWENIIKIRPNYPDAYYKLAIEALKIQDRSYAIRSLNTALKLDPGFAQAQKLKDSVER